ncbi:MAG TPA: LON peptidase substrate-binding domain-containing protein [Candidatus Sulfotelmatobacter sp.]|nr:LON peptidase substrate-binding domain-containing protein [Candidatus Sulfotelmatobacter sp.]
MTGGAPFEYVDASQPPETLPIFPLPSVVLFPNMALPLHIFEDRYKKMTAACLEGNRLLAIPLLKPGWERGEAPEPHHVAGMGRIAQAVRLPGGGYDIVVRGVAKVRIGGTLQDWPYRVAAVEMLEDAGGDGEAARDLARRVAERFRALLAAQPAQGAQLLAHLALLASPVDILYFAASAYPGLGPDDRQALLEELDVAAALGQLLRRMTRDAVRFN